MSAFEEKVVFILEQAGPGIRTLTDTANEIICFNRWATVKLCNMKFSTTVSVKRRGRNHSGAMRQTAPVYEQLAGLLGEMIQSRSLRAGDRMPSVRQFSLQQRVSVPTALRAYVTLETRGLVEARPKSGFYVRSRPADFIPEPAKSAVLPKAAAVGADDPVASLLADISNSKLVPLGAALPSAELLPGIKLTRAMAAIGRKLGSRSIDYDTAPGAEALRRELSRRSLSWGCALKRTNLSSRWDARKRYRWPCAPPASPETKWWSNRPLTSG